MPHALRDLLKYRGALHSLYANVSRPDIPKDASAASLRILYLIDEMEAITAGGTERQVLQMIQMMKESGAHIELCLMRGTEWLKASDVGVPLHFCHFGSIFSLDGLRKSRQLRNWISAQRFDIVQTFFIDASLVGPIIAKLAGVRTVLGSRRNLNYWMTPSLNLFQRFSNLFATRLVANCEAVRRTVCQVEGTSRQKVDVVYNGLDVDYFKEDQLLRRSKRQELGFSDSDIVIGNVSVLRPVKGCGAFIEAAAQVGAKHPEARFVLVGDGPLRSSLEKMAAQSGLDGKIVFAGSQEDVRPFLFAFDLAVLCSESEGFSNSILEYLAAGLPSVVTDVGGNAEAIGPAGVVVPAGSISGLASSISNFISDPSMLNTMKINALQQASHFDIPRTRNTLHQYYLSVSKRLPSP